MLTETAERKIKRAKIDIMRSQNPKLRMWGGILMVGKTYVDDKFPTACTNGRDEWYGRAFIDALKPKEVAFIVLHENLHKACRHLTTWKRLAKENPRLANAAMDYVINLIAVDSDPQETTIAMPKWSQKLRDITGAPPTDKARDGQPLALFDRKYAGMNTKQVYDLLKQEMQQQGGGGSGGDGAPEGHDEHDWAGAQELSEAEKEELEREVDRALRQGAMEAKKMVGKGSLDLPLEIGELLDPQINWKDVLRDFVKSICNGREQSTWRKPNRRFVGQGIYLPTMFSETIGHIVVGVDTSGSIGGAELSSFMSEIADVCKSVKPEKLDLLYWDGRVAGHEEYNQDQLDTLTTSTKPKGGGGTDPTCVERWLEERNMKPECIIMLTDGYVPSWGRNWPAPILWVISNNRDCEPQTGIGVHIND